MRKIIALLLALTLAVGLLTACGNTASTESAAAADSAEPAEAAGTEEPAEAAEPAEAEAPAEEAEAAEAAEEAAPAEQAPVPEDGIYTVTFETDNSMFHVNETCDGKATLTVENGVMTMHITLASKSIVNLYVGKAEDAQKEGAVLLEPTTDTVTYSDGTTDEVYGFDVPVTAVDAQMDLALIGTKGKWYDHVVTIGPAVPAEETPEA